MDKVDLSNNTVTGVPAQRLAVTNVTGTLQTNLDVKLWACGATDNASVYGTEDCRFESCHARETFSIPTQSHFVVLGKFNEDNANPLKRYIIAVNNYKVQSAYQGRTHITRIGMLLS
ncbi:hypothetical protein T10_2845 [Trichinella papuae]|uniref:Uncharacterized protein n=1 Tax=Trichinella papuae TaxID=268474 RepID=A0A0V1MEU8_9BILA|nr:hypothetical protein T10_2845 [Trichinella papuae]